MVMNYNLSVYFCSTPLNLGAGIILEEIKRVYIQVPVDRSTVFFLNLCRPASIGTVRGAYQLFGISCNRYTLMIALQHHHLREDCLYLISCLLSPFLKCVLEKSQGGGLLWIFDFSLQ
jgi:hypothetical protein